MYEWGEVCSIYPRRPAGWPMPLCCSRPSRVLMADSVFDRETMLDISVNIIPLVILLFFIVYTFIWSPYPNNWFIEAIALALHIIPFVLLALLTYISAHYI